MTTLRHLKIFITVAECGTMRKAAEELFISQPSVSQSIQELEEEYQVKLFDRLSKRIYITEAGKTMLTYARQILSSMETMEETLKKTMQSPILRIGASVTVGTVYLEEVLSAFEKNIPDIDLRVVVNNTSTIEKFLLESKLDFAIVEGRVSNDELIQKVLCKDEVIPVVGRTHSLYFAEKLSIADLQGRNLISRESGSVERNQFEQSLAENNIHMIKKWSCTNTEAIKRAVIAGRGIAIISRRLIEKELSEDILRELPIEDMKVIRDFKLITHKDKKFPKEIQDVLENI